jgi:hypothetical protein
VHKFREFADTDVEFKRVHLSPPKIAERIKPTSPARSLAIRIIRQWIERMPLQK